MKRTRRLAAILLAMGGFLAGCGQSADRTATARAATPTQVSKWKYQPKSGGAMGLVIETQGNEATSVSLYTLKEDPGFLTDSRLAGGKYLMRQGVIVLPVGMPQFGTVEQWLANMGPYCELPFKMGATNLMLTLKLPGVPERPLEFLPFQP